MTRPPRSADLWVVYAAAGLWLILFLLELAGRLTHPAANRSPPPRSS